MMAGLSPRVSRFFSKIFSAEAGRMTAIRCSSMEGPGRVRGLLPLSGTGPYAAGISSAEAGEMIAVGLARPVPPSVELTEGSHQKTPTRGIG